MVTLIKTLQVILALSILIFIHELGHFLWARLFGIRVEKFFLFFDIGGRKLLSWKRGETEFGIGWLPLGGYCKIAGMVDESMDMEQLRQEPKPWEFRTHPAWQRLLVMAGGVLNNFIFAIAVYIAVMGIWGDACIPNHNARIYAGELAGRMGFKTGDRILKLDDFIPEDFSSIQSDLVRKDVRVVSVLRGGDTLDIYMDRSLTSEIINTPLLFDIAVPFKVDSVIGPNRDRLLSGDRVIAIQGTGIEFVQDARSILDTLAGQEVSAAILRGTDTLALQLSVDTLGRLGAFMAPPEIIRRRYEGWSAVPAGFRLTGELVSNYLKDLRMLVTPSTGAYKSVGSFIAIGQVFPATWDWYRFMFILALISIMLGVMNLIPIPGLDGGHILFTLYEIITGRKPSDRFLYIMQTIGMILLIMLMILAFGNDIGRLIH